MGALTAPLLAALVLTPAAQSQLPSTRLHRVTAPVRDAGILHVATNTWTRKASAASLGADTIYDNTIAGVYYLGLSGDTVVDEGRLPSPSSPTNTWSRPGCATSYDIEGFQISYCTDRVSPAPFQVRFYGTYVPCASVIGVSPTADILIAGVPGSPSGSTISCWTVTIDLGAPPAGNGLAFTMAADGDGTYAASANSNLFGWSFRSSGAWADQLATGPMIAGDLTLSSTYDGTRWDDPVNYAEDGTGMGTLDQFRIEGGPTTPGCYFFQGIPFLSLHLELYADACVGSTLATQYCFGTAFPNPCPCGNSSSNPGAGCNNSLGAGGRLIGSGLASLSSDTFVLQGSRMPPNGPTLYYQGTDRLNGGSGIQFGDGLRCVGGTVARLRIAYSGASGNSQVPDVLDPALSVLGQVTAPGTRVYQVWYRNAANYCTPATFNLTNGLELLWAP
ncbi:MAG: hypothetical protein NTY35_08845 [Planctomycetota bacterium]|nr:hypothetical protein [Planctomycetota bacterium]